LLRALLQSLPQPLPRALLLNLLQPLPRAMLLTLLQALPQVLLQLCRDFCWTFVGHLPQLLLVIF
jgi:hypothetical protein